MRRELADLTQLDLPATLLFDFPSSDELASHILATLPPPAVRPAAAAHATPTRSLGQPTRSQPTPAVPAADGEAAASQMAENQPAHPVWWYMPAGQRTAWAAEIVRESVVKILGKNVDPGLPLMMAGLDSLGV